MSVTAVFSTETIINMGDGGSIGITHGDGGSIGITHGDGGSIDHGAGSGGISTETIITGRPILR